MNGALVWALVGSALVVVAVRRRSAAVGLVTLQVLALAALAAREATGTGDLLVAVTLGVRAVALGAFFWVVTSRTRDPRLVPAGLTPLRRCALAVSVAMVLEWLVPPVGLIAPEIQSAVVVMVAFGLVLAATNRATIFQVLGIVLIENALVLAVMDLPGTSWLIEIGAAFDLMLVALIAGVFHERIFVEFGAGDTDALRSLRD